jgi:hypothetical protein
MGINLTEPIVIPDIFASGVIPEDLGDGTMRFTGYVQHRSLSYDGVDYVMVSRIIMPKQSIMSSIKATMNMLGISCCGGERMKVLNH